jgi:aspartate ammonia-lyase
MTSSFLANTSLFRALEPRELDLLLAACERSSVRKGEVIFTRGELRDRLRMVVSGRVKLEMPEATPGDWDEFTTVFGPGQFMGEATLLQEGLLHRASCTAITDCAFLLLRRSQFLSLAKKHPEIAGKVLMAVGGSMYQRLGASAGTTTNAQLAMAYSSGRRRLEHDLLGEREIPQECYFGVQTLRARENFHISGVTLRSFPVLVRSLAEVKKAAALANARLGLLDAGLSDSICQACDEIREGHWHEQFVVDMIQGGAGTSTNMNANEVIANRALELLGAQKGDYDVLHPNNHVNLSQSTNDAYPTAVRIAALHSVPQLVEALVELCATLGSKAREFNDVIKMGRTQLQDAVPMTLGQEFEAFRVTLEEDITRIRESTRLFNEVNMGGTAIGTGLNAHRDYAAEVVKALREVTGLPIVSSANLIEATPDTGLFVYFSGVLKRLAVKLSKVCNDLRLLSSGPRCGLGEINLPPMQPGSSIMPGKVNPVIPEVVNQVAFQVIGNDLTVTMAAEAGQLQLNVMEPVIVFNLFQSVTILTRAVRTLDRSCVRGITANRDACRRYVENSIGLVTALNPYIGYENATRIAMEALATGGSVFDLVLARGLMSREKLEEVLKPENMVAR